MSLRARIAILAAAAVAVAVIGVSIVAFFGARRQLVAEVDNSLAQRVLLVSGETLESFRDPGERRAFRGGPAGVIPRGDFDQIYGQLIARSGATVAAPGAEIVLPVEQTDRSVASGERRDLVFRDVTVDDVHLRMVTAPIANVGAIQLARPLTEVDATLSGLAVVLAIVGVGGVGLAAALGTLVARSTLKPIAALTSAAEHVADTQQLAARIDIDRQDEIGRLARSFNAMLAALDESRSQQKRLVHDASHELRTPLTALRTNIEVLARQSEMTSAQRTDLLADVTAELGELGTLVAELVDLATDPSSVDEPMISLRLDELLATAVNRARRRTGRPISLDAEPLEIEGRPAQLERAVGNLIENAHKWSPEEEKIEVTLHDRRVSVIDHGPGIDPADRPHVFDRFYRATAARSMPGSGLGLSIVSQIVEAHGGSVFVEATPGGGATVGFDLP